MLETPFYIACLKLSGRRCVVVGGGEIGLEKVEGLLACDRRRDPHRSRCRPRARGARRRGARSAGSARGYAGEQDLEGVFMVIASTDDTDVHIAVYDDAERRAMLVNVVEVPPLCNFILPAIVRTGPLAIAISDRGCVAGAGKAMKAEISELFGEEYAQLAVMLNDVRGWAKGTLANLPGPQDVLREHRQRRARPDRAASRRRRAGRARPHRVRAQRRRGSLNGRADPPRLRRHRSYGRRRRQGGDCPPRRRAGDRAHDPGDRARVAAGDAPKGGRPGRGADRRHPGGQRTGELIPLCHPLGLDHVDVEAALDASAGTVVLTASAAVTARTGVEMEAMTAAAVAALTVYDMVKGLERGVRIEAVELVSKSGGRSGEWTRD